MVLDMMIRTPSLTSSQKDKNGQAYTAVTGVALNEWSKNKIKRIEVLDYLLNPRDVSWKGKTITTCDYELFTLMVKQWISEGMTKEEALDLMFEM